MEDIPFPDEDKIQAFPKSDTTQQFVDTRDWQIIHVPLERDEKGNPHYRLPLDICRWIADESNTEEIEYDTRRTDYIAIRYVLKAGGQPPPRQPEQSKIKGIHLPKLTRKGWVF